MFKRNLKLYIITLFVLLGGIATAGIISRFTTFTDGTVLNAADLNGEFNQLVNLVNGNLDNDNISATAAISPVKITSAIAGDGLAKDGSTGALSVNTDGSTIETNADAIRVKDNGITVAKLAQLAGLSVLGNSTASTGNVAGIAAGTDAYVLRRSGTAIGFGQVATGGIADGSVTIDKLETTSNQITTSSSGTFNTTSLSFVDVPNLGATIATHGRAVLVQLQSANTSDAASSATTGTVSSNSTGALSVKKDGVSIAVSVINPGTGGTGRIPCAGYSVIDPVTTVASHTYKVQIRSVTAGNTIVTDCNLVVVEL